MAESPVSGLAAEAAALSRERLCDGTDRHVLGWSGRVRAAVLGGGIGLVVLLALTGQFAHFGAVGIGLLLGASLGAGMSTSVSGDQVLVSRFGYRRRVSLASVRRVERYQYRSNVSLRLRDVAGERLATLPMSAPGYRLTTAAARHLLKYLDRPDVVWQPRAWQTLSDVAGTVPSAAEQQPSGAQPEEHVISAPHPGPRGRWITSKPASGWAKVALYGSVLAIFAFVVFIIVLVPLSWRDYLESRRIQHGPEVVATLHNESITSSSDRYGTHHTTHFAVSFTTLTGESVTTVVKAHGQYNQLPEGYRFPIRYDPDSPRHAELPRAPDSSLSSAVILSVIAAFAVVTVGGFGRRIIRIRRIRGAASGIDFGRSFEPGGLQAQLDKLKVDMAGRSVDEIKPALQSAWRESTGGGDITEPTLTTIAQSIADGKRVVLNVTTVRS